MSTTLTTPAESQINLTDASAAATFFQVHQDEIAFISDAGHGWLKVPYTLIDQSGIAPQVSTFSYMQSGYAYLEEDCDAGLFLRAIGAYNFPEVFRSRVRFVDHGDRSYIRNMARFDETYMRRWIS